MDDNDDKDSLAVAAYRKFRRSEATRVKHDTTDAAQLYKRYGAESELSESQRERNIAAILSSVEHDANKRKVVGEILQQIDSPDAGPERATSVTDRSQHNANNGSDFGLFSAPLNLLRKVRDSIAGATAQLAIPAAAVCFLAFALIAFFNFGNNTISENQTIASIPGALVDDGVISSIAASTGSKSGLGLTDSSSVSETLFQLGATTTQLEVSSALGEEALVENTVTMLDLLSAAVESEEVAVNVQSLIKEAGLDQPSSGAGLTTVLENLHQSLRDTDPSSQSFRWYRLGQLMESLRLALTLASEEGNNAALVEVRAMLNVFDLQSIDTPDSPELGVVLEKIAEKVSGSDALVVSDYRTLSNYTDQVFVLLQ